MKKVLFVFGTRPEAIKMAPLIRELQSRPAAFRVEVCLTAQHRAMLDQVTAFFGIRADHDLDIMRPGQSLFDVTAGVLTGMEKVLRAARPDLCIVQGDTTTVLAGALASFYERVPVAHLEAGLRSGDLYSPYPEEANRCLVSRIARWHFAPTAAAAANLAREGISREVHVTGNTVVDALRIGLGILEEGGEAAIAGAFGFLDPARRCLLVTGHRRESFGGPFEEICRAIRDLAARPDVQVVYPVHLNPNVREPVNRILGGLPNVHLVEPVEYPSLLWLLKRSHLVLTDSGGIQEEAPALGKPVLVMREVTERGEGVAAGTARLVGTSYTSILANAAELLDDGAAYAAMARAVNPYGDGHAAERIADILEAAP